MGCDLMKKKLIDIIIIGLRFIAIFGAGNLILPYLGVTAGKPGIATLCILNQFNPLLSVVAVMVVATWR